MRLAEDLRFELTVEVFLAWPAAEHALFGCEGATVGRILTDTLSFLAEVVHGAAVLVIALGVIGAVLTVGLCRRWRRGVLFLDHGPIDDLLQRRIVRLFAGRQKTDGDHQDIADVLHADLSSEVAWPLSVAASFGTCQQTHC